MWGREGDGNFPRPTLLPGRDHGMSTAMVLNSRHGTSSEEGCAVDKSEILMDSRDGLPSLCVFIRLDPGFWAFGTIKAVGLAWRGAGRSDFGTTAI